jgi:formate hydrogenlyase transcriptional activator
MAALVNWEWPGNVRELENLMERSVILSEGPVLNAPLAEMTDMRESSTGDGTLEALERQYIIRVLRKTGGVIAGPRGAAVRLGMKRTILQSRILEDGYFPPRLRVIIREISPDTMTTSRHHADEAADRSRIEVTDSLP